MQRVPAFSSGGNPFGQYNSMTTNTEIAMRAGYHNFNQAFTPNQPMIDRPDFRNKNDVIHNNLGDNLLQEHISEFQVHVDTFDRSLNVYPSPFKFTITFGGTGKEVFRSKKNFKSGTTSKDDDEFVVDATPGPVINRRFKNVKYVKLFSLFLPKTTHLIINDKGEYECVCDPCKQPTKYKYLIVKIKELASRYMLSSNSVIGDDGFIVYPDKTAGNNHIIWTPLAGSRIYTNADLGNLERLTIQVLDPQGKPLVFINDTTGKEVDFTILIQKNPSVPDSQVTSLRKLYPNLQCTISFMLGIVENEINTSTKFED